MIFVTSLKLAIGKENCKLIKIRKFYIFIYSLIVYYAVYTPYTSHIYIYTAHITYLLINLVLNHVTIF